MERQEIKFCIEKQLEIEEDLREIRKKSGTCSAFIDLTVKKVIRIATIAALPF